MDTTTIVVILIFALSIVSGVTKSRDSSSLVYTPPGTYIQKPENVLIPGPGFNDGAIENINSRIDGFIRGYALPSNRGDAAQITDSIMKYARQFNVNPLLLTALIGRESRFNKYAISKSGAQGLGQLLPSTSRGMGVNDPFNVDENVMGTTRYLRYLLTRFEKKSSPVTFAIAGYLEGPNDVFRNNGYKPSSGKYVEDVLKLCQKI